MRFLILIICCATVLRVVASPEADSAKTPSYFAKWTMVKMFPVPQSPLTDAAVAILQHEDDAKKNYTLATYLKSSQLESVEEILHGKRKVKFVYVYDHETVIRIDLFLGDGTQQIYYRR